MSVSEPYRRIGTPGLIWFATALGLVAILAIVGVVAREFYLSTLQTTEQQASNLAALIQQNVQRDIELYELSIQAVVDGLNDDEVMRQTPRIRHMALFDRAITAHGLGGIIVLDKTGNIVLDSANIQPRNVNLADREYFRVHRASEEDRGLHISHPFWSRIGDPAWSIAVSRRVNRQDGSFEGVVAGTIKLETLRDHFLPLALGVEGSITLLRDDGTLLIRNKENDRFLGSDWSGAKEFQRLASNKAGTFWSNVSMDGVPRFYAFKKVGTLPLIVLVGLAERDVLAPWFRKLSILFGVYLLMAAALIGVVTLFVRELRKREDRERHLASLAREDGLTKLTNRLGLAEALEREWLKRRADSPLSLLMIDIDYFKRLNDAFGHLEGDEVLCRVAAAVRASAPSAICARYGGEEIAVLLPNTGASEALQRAERIRCAVELLSLPHPESPHRVVSISVGVATATGSTSAASSVLIQRADKALYAAKARGRNTVSLAEPADNRDANAMSEMAAA
jgi:diguanylate cyclase (GGDEF)-like protein